MKDGKVSLTKTLAWTTWALAGLFTLACVVVDGIAGETTTGGMVLCTLALLLGAAAATLHIRSFLCCQQERIKWAYKLGYTAGRSDTLEGGEGLRAV